MAESQTQTRLANDPQMPTTGSVVGRRYEIIDVLGEGGFAVVYAAYDARTKAKVAVKVLDPIMSRRSEFASRFIREVETVSQLRHHNTISIFDAGETENGCLFLVMELLDGRSLDVMLEEQGALPPERVKRIAIQILKSLQEAHSRGIIHRDLKPANVFIADLAGEEDYVKVLDFGIAKSIDDSQDSSLTATGQVMCSPHYVAPERVKEHLTVPASDLYSLGVMMIELLEGAPPYEAESPMMLAVKHLAAEPVPMGPASQRAPFAAVVQRACAKSLEQRYDSAIEMLDDLMQAVDRPILPVSNETVASPTPSITTELDVDAHEPPKKRGLLWAAALLLLIGGGAAGATVLMNGDPEPEPTPAVAAVVPPAPPERAEPEPEVEPEPAPVVTASPADAVRTAYALLNAAVQTGFAESMLAAGNLAGDDAGDDEEERVAAVERDERRDDRRRDERDEPERGESERARSERDSEPAEETVPTPVPTPVAVPETPPVVETSPAAETDEGADDEDDSPRRRIRTNVAPRQ